MNGNSHRVNTIVALAKVMVLVVVGLMGIVVVLAKVMVSVVVNDRAEDQVLESRMHLL